MNDQYPILGTRLALLGAIWYLLEFAVIIPFYSSPPAAGSSAADLAAYYVAHRAHLTMYMIGVSAAILGRLAFISALRGALRLTKDTGALLDLAFAASVVGVTVETIAMSIIGVALSLATFGLEPPVVVAAALHHASTFVTSLVDVPHGLFAATASLAMLRVRVLSRWIGWTGLVGGIVMALTVNPGFYPDHLQLIRDNVQFLLGWLFIVVWMLATGVVLFKRARQLKTSTLLTTPA